MGRDMTSSGSLPNRARKAPGAAGSAHASTSLPDPAPSASSAVLSSNSSVSPTSETALLAEAGVSLLVGSVVVRCFVCWTDFSAYKLQQLRGRLATCGSDCRRLYLITKNYIDKAPHLVAQARHVLRHPERRPKGDLSWAERVLAGQQPKRESYWKGPENSKAKQALRQVEALRAGKTPPESISQEAR